MWRSKKFILVASLIAIVLVGSTAGVVLARSANGGEGTGVIALAQTSDNTSSTTLLARVAKILGIDQKQVEDAFAQAQRDMQQEALDAYLKKLVDQGKITQEQADQYKSWWQARPETPLSGPFECFGADGFLGGMRWGGAHQHFNGEPNSDTGS